VSEANYASFAITKITRISGDPIKEFKDDSKINGAENTVADNLKRLMHIVKTDVATVGKTADNLSFEQIIVADEPIVPYFKSGNGSVSL